jgi:cysteine desulfurase
MNGFLMKGIYFDYASTTPVDARVLKAMLPFFSEKAGNPSSFHSAGLEAKNALDSARGSIASNLGCLPEEIIFTGSGTESCNLAIKGAALAARHKGRHIITSKIEHHAVLNSCEWLEKEMGFAVTYLDVNGQGIVNPAAVEKAIRKDTVLISVMYANNEIGTVQPIKEIAMIARAHGIPFHTDSCQAAGYLDIDVRKLGVDLLTLNGSKIYAPKGVGLLFVRKGVELTPLIHGGAHEFGLRAGTENVASIVGLAKALEIAQRSRIAESKRLSVLRDFFIKGLLKIPGTVLNGHPQKRLPNNVNVSFLDIEGESILLHLDSFGIFASTGSACSSQSLEPSHVILAIRPRYEAAHGSIRFSLGRKTTRKQIVFVLKVLPGIVEKLRAMSPVHLEKKEVFK